MQEATLLWKNVNGLQNVLKKRFDNLDQAWTGSWIQYQRRTRRLLEIEILSQIAENRCIFAYVRTRVGAVIRLRVNALAREKIIFNKLDIRVEAESLVINITSLCVRTDDETRHAESISVYIHCRRNHMIIKTTPVVPCQKYRGARPIRPLHNGVDQTSDICLSNRDG